ncbi:hypothetical protein GCM10023346_45750 [Arthrobacter gyeryongensis]|uniref:Terminase small subunit n=1 Tax=Arthrobacter gyeryongensis TaxID=1650592 RepID=A0ABP9SVF7_9MICC
MEMFKHGANGYRRHGCRCQTCKDAHASERRRQRAKVNGGPGLSVVHGTFPALPAEPEPTVERGPVGTTESAVEAEIEALADAGRSWSPECARLENQIMIAARTIDKVIADGRVHLAPPYFRIITQSMAELKSILAPARIAGTRTAEDDMKAAQAEIEADFGGPLGSPDPADPYHLRTDRI